MFTNPKSNEIMNELNNKCSKNDEDSSENDEDSSENGDVKFRHILYYCENCGEIHSKMFLESQKISDGLFICEDCSKEN